MKCAWCGDEYNLHDSDADDPEDFCSSECEEDHLEEIGIAWANAQGLRDDYDENGD